jgi:phage terminase large subunit-like protein
MKDHSAEVQHYIDGVRNGSIVAGKYIRHAVERHVRDLTRDDLEFDPHAANRAINFFPCIKHTTGEFKGQPFELRMFQKFIIWCLFGWKRLDGWRRFRRAFISLGRGNGKSPFAAGIALFMLTMDNEARAEVYSFATKEKQARVVWEEASHQVGTSPVLSRLVTRLSSNMHVLSTGSKFEPKGSDSKKNDGLVIHCAVKDEVHAWSHYHRGLNETIETAMGKRTQPMALTITTAGDDQSELWLEEYEFNVAVVTPDSGVESDEHFVFIAEIDKDEPCGACQGKGCDECDQSGVVAVDALEERYWAQANPMLNEPNSPVKIEHLRSLAAKARAFPTHRNMFLRYHANQLVASFYRLIPAELWATGNSPVRELEGKDCFAGFDWGWRNDLAGLALVFPTEDGSQRSYDLIAHCWVPEGCEHDLTREPWASFIAGGFLTVTSGNTTDVDAIYGTMQEIVSKYSVRQLAYDPNNAREFSTKCVNEWGIETYDFFQTCRRYNEPSRELVKALKDGRIRHGGNPLLAWCANNLTVKQDSNDYIMPCKGKSQGKVDPLVATCMAMGLAMTNETTTGPLFYA